MSGDSKYKKTVPEDKVTLSSLFPRKEGENAKKLLFFFFFFDNGQEWTAQDLFFFSELEKNHCRLR